MGKGVSNVNYELCNSKVQHCLNFLLYTVIVFANFHLYCLGKGVSNVNYELCNSKVQHCLNFLLYTLIVFANFHLYCLCSPSNVYLDHSFSTHQIKLITAIIFQHFIGHNYVIKLNCS